MRLFKYNKTLFTAINLLFFTFITTSFSSCNQKKDDIITIATAANMQYVMSTLTKEFTKKTNINCEIIVGSSGKLTAQIKAGAPYSIFVSANTKYPDELHKNKQTTNKPRIYAYGNLVLWSLSDSISPNLNILTSKKITHIATANPTTAPYGKAAIEVLTHYDILNEVKSKLVYGESISQTNQFITTQSAEVGFTAKAVVLSPKMKNKGKWIDITPEAYLPIAQSAVILKNGNKNAAKFYNFLFSAHAKKILTKFGYTTM